MTRLELAMLAGSYAITNSRFGKNGGTYVNGVFSPNPEKIPFGEAAKVLSDTSCEKNVFVCPVKPGQTVYIPYKIVIDGEKCGINAEKVGTITFYENSGYAHFERDLGGFNEAYWMADVFPTREAAEKRLEEMKS